MDDLPEVELHPAWYFICEACGRDNYGRSPVVEPECLMPSKLPDGLTARDVIEAVTGEPCQDDDRFLLWPDDVTCRHCGSKYRIGDI